MTAQEAKQGSIATERSIAPIAGALGQLLPMGDWRRRAACFGLDPGLFHPEGIGGGWAARSAKRVCAGCAVRQECLEYAMATETVGGEQGIWGGMAPKERRQLRRQRQKAARAFALLRGEGVA